MAPYDVSLTEPQIPGSTTGSPMIVEKLSHKESGSETDRKVSGQ